MVALLATALLRWHGTRLFRPVLESCRALPLTTCCMHAAAAQDRPGRVYVRVIVIYTLWDSRLCVLHGMHLHGCVQAKVNTLEAQLVSAQTDKANAEQRLKDVMLQARNVENAYDALMREHTQLQRQKGVDVPGRKKGD
jgi:hypothetical protein